MKKKGAFVFYLFYFVIFFAGSIIGSFMSMYLVNHGISSSSVGLINGVIQLIGLVAYPLVGRLADRTRTKNVVLSFGLLISLVLLYIFYKSPTVLMLEIMMVVFNACYNPLMIVYETITMDFTAKNGIAYAPIRMTGTIGFSIMAAIAGFFLASREELLFPILIAVFIVVTIVSFFMPRAYNQPVVKEAREDVGARSKNTSVYSMLKDREVFNVMLLFGIYNLTASFNMSYFGIRMQEIGGDYLLVGLANMIMGFSEIPFHVGPGRRWMKRIGVENSMIVVCLVGAVRWVICALTKNPYVFGMTMAMNGIMLVPNIVDVLEFLYDKAPDDLKTSVQSGLRSPFQVGGMLLANFGGSLAIAYFTANNLPGIQIIYTVCAPICLLAVAYVWLSRKKKSN